MWCNVVVYDGICAHGTNDRWHVCERHVCAYEFTMLSLVVTAGIERNPSAALKFHCKNESAASTGLKFVHVQWQRAKNLISIMLHVAIAHIDHTTFAHIIANNHMFPDGMLWHGWCLLANKRMWWTNVFTANFGVNWFGILASAPNAPVVSFINSMWSCASWFER